MNLAEFRKLTKDLPEDTPILLNGCCYSFKDSLPLLTTAIFDKDNLEYMKDFGEDLMPEKEFGKRKKVIVIKEDYWTHP